MNTPLRYTAVGFLALALPAPLHPQEARQRYPCGPDGSECQCMAGEWQWSYQDFYGTNFEDPSVAVRGIARTRCENREECAAEYRAFVARERRDAEGYRADAERNLESARRYQSEGDDRWYRIFMENHRWAAVQAEASDRRASSAVPPHCDLDKVRERLLEEFGGGAPTSGDDVDWVIPRTRSDDQVGVTTPVPIGDQPPFQPSDRTRDALAEMVENWHRAGALAVIVGAAPILMTASNLTYDPARGLVLDEAGVAVDLVTFPWKAWGDALETLESRLDPFVRQRNREICLMEYLFWSQPRRGETATAERRFWGSVCRGM